MQVGQDPIYRFHFIDGRIEWVEKDIKLPSRSNYRRFILPNKKVPITKTKALPIGSLLCCANEEGTELKIIGVKKHKGSRGTVPSASIGDMITAVVSKSHNRGAVGKIVSAIVIRQKKAWRRQDDSIMSFEDNAAVIVREDGTLPKHSEVSGVVPIECTNLWPLLKTESVKVI
jgi:ribosomal protein L14